MPADDRITQIYNTLIDLQKQVGNLSAETAKQSAVLTNIEVQTSDLATKVAKNTSDIEDIKTKMAVVDGVREYKSKFYGTIYGVISSVVVSLIIWLIQKSF